MTSPWKKIDSGEGPVNFLEITSEQLARSLQEKELNYSSIQTNEGQVIHEDVESCDSLDADTTNSDEIIAHMLQSEFNEEYDLMLKRTEDKINQNSKVNISYSNYRTSSTINDQLLLLGTENTDEEKKDFDRFVSVEKEYASIPRCGYKKIGNESKIVTKHDMLMSSRINACRVLQFPPGICTGDTGGFDVKLNNKVFNSLRAHSHAQCSRMKDKQRVHTPHK